MRIVSNVTFSLPYRTLTAKVADESGRNAYGCVNQLFQMKKDHRNMKVILSIGGWTWSANFSAVSSSSASRHVFATSAVSLMKDWGLDGLDIDWEFPLDKQEGLNFLELLRAVRHELDEYAAQHAPGHRFQLSIAAPAGKKHYENLPLAEMSAVVDSFNLMTYDFAGPWSDNAAHTANLYVAKSNPSSTPYSIELAVQAYMETGVPSKKIVLGVPLFGRAFQNTQGLGHPFSGVGKGSWEKGTWDYKALPKLDATVMHDSQADADYTFDGHELISYDTPRAVREKAGYVRDVGLGGLMFWEASADRNDSDSLVGTASRELRQIDVTKNWLSYPDSKFDNLG